MRAKAPATPIFSAPAPAVAWALKSLVPSPPRLSSLILASRMMLLAVMLLLMLAWLVISTMFNATATPMPTALFPTALPSAMALASVSFDAASLRFPPALITTPVPREALTVESARFRANPAAIDTAPSLVSTCPCIFSSRSSDFSSTAGSLGFSSTEAFLALKLTECSCPCSCTVSTPTCHVGMNRYLLRFSRVLLLTVTKTLLFKSSRVSAS